MRNHTIPALLTGLVIGTAGGWLAKPASPPAGNSAPETVRTETKRSPRDDQAKLEKSRVAQRWIDRIGKDNAQEVVVEIPAGDMQALMEKMMGSMWGRTSDGQLRQLMLLMNTWADKDPEGALAWARTLEVPQQREIAFSGIAGVVGKTDPMAGFAIYAELGEVTQRFGGDLLEPMMGKIFQDAAGKGVDAILDIARRMPANKTNGLMALSIDYPEGFDFAKLMDGLATVTSEGGDFKLLKPYQLSNPLGKWALRDPDAAFDYAIARTGGDQRVDLDDVAYEIGQKSGSLEAERWMGEKLGSLDPEQTATLLPRSGLLHSPGMLRKYIAAMPEESVAEFQFQAIQATTSCLEILLDVPQLEDRLAVIERLRGVKEPGSIRHYLGQWQVPKDRIEQLVATISQPKP